jgi:hypothetical protein
MRIVCFLLFLSCLFLLGFTLRLGHPPVFCRTKGVQTVNIIEQKYKEDHASCAVVGSFASLDHSHALTQRLLVPYGPFYLCVTLALEGPMSKAAKIIWVYFVVPFC